MDMEFLDLEIDEMDEIQKSRPTYDFPVVSFHKGAHGYTAYFNRHAAKILGNCAYIKVYANAEYVVFRPSDKKDHHGYKFTINKAGGRYINCASFERFMLDGKIYKLYNTQKGLAIKINDPLKKRK